jgi:hypothetical protein
MIISLMVITWVVFVVETQHVLCEITAFLNIISMKFRLHGVGIALYLMYETTIKCFFVG